MKKHLVLFLFCLLTPINSWCQDAYYENITLESGLPNESVYDVFKDSKGYIWLATNLGLLRFDGTNYVSFQNDSGLSISGSFIKEAFDGSIWYQSFDGYIFRVKNNELKPYKPEKPSGFKPYALQDSILVRTSLSGLEKYNLLTGKKTTLKFSSTLNFCHLINQTIITGNSKLYFIDVTTNKVKKKMELDTQFNSFFSVANEKTIAIADKSLKKTPIILLNENGIFKRGYLLLEETLQNIYLFEKEIWCFTKEGIQVFDYDFNPIPEKKILHKKNTSSFTKDKNHFLWIGSPTNGIFLIKDLNSKEVVIENDEFSAISQKNGSLYCGTNKGIIYQYDASLKNKLHFDTQDKNYILFMDFNSYSQFNFFTSNNFYIQNLTNPSIYKDYPSVKDIAKIDEKTVALAATNFAGRFTLEDFKTENTLYERAFLQNIRAKSIAYDTLSNTYYIATNIGLYKRKANKNLLITHKNKPLFFKKIRLKDQVLYGITVDGKLLKLDNNKLSVLGNKNQFQSLKKIDNSIFVSSNHAIYEWTNTTLTKTFEVSKFLQIRDFEILNNTAFVITKNKLIALEKNTSIQKNELPNILIEKITVNDKIKPFDNPFQNSYLENKVVIHYNIINFDYFNEYEYYYELNNKKFSLNVNQKTIDLPNLNSGNYSFQIYAKRINETSPIVLSKNVTFEILPPFWKRLWFVLGVFALLTLTFYVIYKVKVKNIRKKNEIAIEKLTLENNLKESRLQLIKSQMNPHFFFNAINNIQSYIFTNETREASQYLSKFSKLTRKILEFSDVNTVSLKEEIEALTLYLELQQMRFKDFCYEIKLENISHPESIKIPTMLFQPYIENAILHGLSHSNHDKKVEVKFHWNQKNVLTTTIYDNGIGRVKSAELNSLNTNKPKSFATKANLERIMLLNKDQYQINISYEDLYHENLESTGTLVTITIAL